jgi:hypothetical protein
MSLHDGMHKLWIVIVNGVLAMVLLRFSGTSRIGGSQKKIRTEGMNTCQLFALLFKAFRRDNWR